MINPCLNRICRGLLSTCQCKRQPLIKIKSWRCADNVLPTAFIRNTVNSKVAILVANIFQLELCSSGRCPGFKAPRSYDPRLTSCCICKRQRTASLTLRFQCLLNISCSNQSLVIVTHKPNSCRCIGSPSTVDVCLNRINNYARTRGCRRQQYWVAIFVIDWIALFVVCLPVCFFCAASFTLLALCFGCITSRPIQR